MVSEMEPSYKSSKTAMLQTFICHLPNAEHSFIFPVKFPWVLFCLSGIAPDCQGSMAHTKVTCQLKQGLEITPAFAQVSPGLWGNRHCQTRQAPPNAGSASAFCPTATEHDMYGATLEAPPQAYLWAQNIPSWSAEGYRRGQPVTLCLGPGWLVWMTPSQMSFTTGAWSRVQPKGRHL